MIAIRIRLAGAVACAGLAACTLGSPTYISTEDAKSDGGGGPVDTSSSASSTSPAGDTTGGGGATCGGDDYVKPDLAKLTACGNGLGHCYDAAKVALASQLVACADATMVCVPDEILEANGGKLQSCTSIIGPGGCIHAALVPEIEKQGGSALKQDVCPSGALCVPCADPTHGNAPTPFCQPIGVHSGACASAPAGGDAGAADAAPLPGCCTTKGKSNGVCISSDAVPASQKSQTKQDTCADGDACVPAAFVAGAPVKCSSGLLGDGVCLDKCFNGLMGAAGDIGLLSKTGCGDTEVCVPCTFIKGTGAPGCS